MAKTLSQMLELGTPLPSFSLPDCLTQHNVASSEAAGKVCVVLFTCNHCPFVIHVRSAIVKLGEYCAEHGAKMFAINSNDVQAYPADSPAAMAEEARRYAYPFPYLFDESQEVAKAFQAACTPDLYIFGSDGKLAYRGRLDAASPGNNQPITGNEALAAVEALLHGKQPSAQQTPSIGCGIKWKPGNAPA